MFRNAYARPSGLALVLATVLLLAACMAAQTKKVEKPAEKSAGDRPPVEIITIPSAGAGPGKQELIAGRVSIANPGSYRLCIYSHTDRWYVQPYVAAPFTDINSSTGRWQTRIHLGDEYAVLLVRPSYTPPSTMLELPKVGGDIIAIAREAAR
jgi:hypothetical protein